MSTKFFTNDPENTLLEKFEGVFQYNNIHQFDALVGYFRSSGYFRVRPFLDKVPQVRILVGINVDKLLNDATQMGLEFFKDQNAAKEDFIEKVVDDIKEAKYDKQTEEGIIQFITDLVDKKLEIRAHPEKKLHAKVYIFRPEPFNEHTPASVITGSSNFTDAGLGFGNQHNYEFNVILNDYTDVVFASEEFEKLWNEGVQILPADISKLKKITHLNDEITPYELYLKMLMEFFGSSIDYDPDSMGDLPGNFKKLSYQVDAVNEGFNMLLKHNGFILADVVGLGKTVIAAMIAKRYLIENGRETTRILVVYPPPIEKNWKNTFKSFTLDRYTKFISNGSLKKILEGDADYWNKEEYDLIIVDEAHKFRNHETESFNDLQLICKSPRKNSRRVAGLQKKVILVTATPLNNRPDDILHQISLFQDLRQSTLPVRNLTSFFSPLVEEYKKLKMYEELDIDKLREIYGKIRKNIVEPITVRRTRTDIENNDDYKKDIEEQNIIFPTVNPPVKIEYIMNEKLNELFHRTVFYLTDSDKILYYRYQAIYGLKQEIQNKYYENAERVSKSLAFIMKTLLIKRLESSFFSFKKSLNTFQKATDRMIEMFANDKIFIAPDTDVNKLLDKGWSEDQIEKEIEKLSEKNPKNRTFKRDDFKPGFLEGLKKDSKNLKELVEKWDQITEDPKLEMFLLFLDNRFLDKMINLEKKLVIFSESKDTVEYLTGVLKERKRNDVLSISSENRRSSYDLIVNNFDANIPEENQKNDYNILITTEVLAEGVNLHRSNVVIHYDTPWNSTRLMQRIGRVNRIGTKSSHIHNFVFYPSAQGDAQIKLNRTALMKIQGFHTAFGEDNQVFSIDEVLDDVTLFSGQIKEEEDEKLKYLFFLRKLRKTEPALFEKVANIPLKARTGRDSTVCEKEQLSGNTVAFLKTNLKHEFYLVNDTEGPNEITPLDAIKIFEAKIDEPSVPLIENHHDHVLAALEFFRKEDQKANNSQTDPTALGGVAQRAKQLLTQVAKHQSSNTELQNDLLKLIKLIDIGKYTNLASDIDKLQKKGRKTGLKIHDYLLELEETIQKYGQEEHDLNLSGKKRNSEPQLILSQSFK